MKTTCEDECNGNREGDTLWKCQGFASNKGHSKESVKGVKGQREKCVLHVLAREIINVAIDRDGPGTYLWWYGRTRALVSLSSSHSFNFVRQKSEVKSK
jgi:hypothetical protein